MYQGSFISQLRCCYISHSIGGLISYVIYHMSEALLLFFFFCTASCFTDSFPTKTCKFEALKAVNFRKHNNCIIACSGYLWGFFVHYLSLYVCRLCFSFCRMSVSQSSRATSKEARPRRQRLPELQPVRVLDREDEGLSVYM